jgi:hypothetical protein
LVTSERSSFTRVNAGAGEFVEGSDPLVFTGLPPSLVVAMEAVSHMGVRFAKRARDENIFGGSYVVGASNFPE